MATTLPRTGVVIVGVGAAGGVAALPLAEAGIDVVGVEAGPWLSTRDMAPDELRLQRGVWPPGPQKVDGEVPTSRPNPAANTTRGANHPMMNGVGGTAMHYMAQAWRLNPWDFRVVSETTRRYGASRIPAGSTVEDWPLSYEDLEPSYDRVEYELGVSGTAGNLNGKIIETGNVFEGPRRREYPMPALRSSGFMDRMSSAAQSLGLHPFTGPAAITSRPYEGRPACVYHGFCIGAGCHVNAKSSPAVSTIPKAQKTGRFNVVAEAHVTRIEVGRDGRAAGVAYIKGGEEFLQPADVVLLASHTYENVRLLLLSTSPAFPFGLSNNHRQVGQHYFSHAQGGGLTALFPFDLRNWYGTPGQGICVDDWADDNFDHGGLDFVGGGTMYVYSERRPLAAVNGLGAWGRSGPNWGSDWKAHVVKNVDRTNGAYMQRTTLPYEGNYLDLDPATRDPLGNPVIRITASYRDNEEKIGTFVGEKMRQWYMAAGAVQVQGSGTVNAGAAMGPSTHAYGGTRMGHNPDTNVVDQWGMSHEVPNLGIMGGSVMGTSGARNPTLTLQALAWRTADHVARNWKTIVK
ncbi:MAG TPA: GMC family oxidoreductase [Vicinamibacterales bacterium]|jgi:gluconate 2-dehydrogenase alpha chain|nr:GMC family oxidoreductase [Vicinamibacterales bacterium]